MRVTGTKVAQTFEKKCCRSGTLALEPQQDTSALARNIPQAIALMLRHLCQIWIAWSLVELTAGSCIMIKLEHYHTVF
jgi:hypothetical protein